MEDIVPGQRALGARLGARRVGNEQRHKNIKSAEIVAGIDGGDAVHLAGGLAIDRADMGARKGAAHERHMQRTFERNVVDEAAFAAHQLGIGKALHAFSEHGGRHAFMSLYLWS